MPGWKELWWTMPEGERLFVFLHIPRTGGTSLLQVLRRQYSPPLLYEIDGARVQESIHRLATLPTSEKAQLACIAGHCPWGVHQLVGREAVYFAVVREPVSRIISHYFYVLNNPAHYLHRKVVESKMTLEEYAMSNLSSELSNGQVRLLWGDENASDTQLERALPELFERLTSEQFIGVGTTEWLYECVLALARALRWRSRFLLLGRVNSATPRCSLRVPAVVRRRIAERNWLDVQLYKFVRKKVMPDFLRREGVSMAMGRLYRLLCWGAHSMQGIAGGRLSCLTQQIAILGTTLLLASRR